jgi:hypothetical protein
MALFRFHIRWRNAACPIFHHLDCYIRTNRAFKSRFIVVRLVRLDAGEPHLCLADFAKRATDDPLEDFDPLAHHASFFGYGRLTKAWLKLGGKARGVTQALSEIKTNSDEA